MNFSIDNHSSKPESNRSCKNSEKSRKCQVLLTNPIIQQEEKDKVHFSFMLREQSGRNSGPVWALDEKNGKLKVGPGLGLGVAVMGQEYKHASTSEEDDNIEIVTPHMFHSL